MKKSYLFILILFCFLLAPSKTWARSFSLAYDNQTFPVDATEINDWGGRFVVPTNNYVTRTAASSSNLFDQLLNQQNQSNHETETQVFYTNPSLLYKFVKTTAETLNSAPIEPALSIENNHVTNFSPPTDGLKVDVYQTFVDSLAALEKDQTSATMTVDTISPQNSLAQTNTLGISELIARGTSNFKGSPNNRRHNIAVGVEKFKGVLVAPGEEFSFNENLGPVEKEQGFLPELVIKAEGTIPELGGGLCQVSSTTFRAAMQAGLPITQRRNHAYAVQYYAPQGTDATIYPGVVDLKFVNNTPGYILIWPYFKDKDDLYFDFYGTKDNRQVTLEKPVQFDRKSDGSMKATWTREIVNNGTTTIDTFKSTYASPALYHKTEQFVTAAPPANAGLQIPKTN